MKEIKNLCKGLLVIGAPVWVLNIVGDLGSRLLYAFRIPDQALFELFDILVNLRLRDIIFLVLEQLFC